MHGSMSLKVLGIVSMKFVILTAPRVAMQSSRKRRLDLIYVLLMTSIACFLRHS